MKTISRQLQCAGTLIVLLSIFSCESGQNKAQLSLPLYLAAPANVETRWISPENPTGERAQGGTANKGAKGNAFYIIAPSETKTLMDVKGAGIINRMWVSGTLATSAVQRRAVRIDMYWDGAKSPAVSAPFGDFFGLAHGLMAKMDNQLFQSPEARSFNFTIPMPFKQSAFITITNESKEEVWLWYDINYLKMDQVPDNALYFHAHWNRNMKTTPGVDFTILPQVEGNGRYLGANIGVIGDTVYTGTWFGEGEVKIYLDGDTEHPTLVGTGTEDYIGTGWGQGTYTGRYFGSPVAFNKESNNPKLDIYAFYRYHIDDPVYFHKDCRVTIQQMGNTNRDNLRRLIKQGANLIPVWALDESGGRSTHRRLLAEDSTMNVFDDNYPVGSSNFYRSDDVCATAYFYLDQPSNGLEELPPASVRLEQLEERVWK